jgi:4'-phosphopantetheinyl transferase
MKQIHWMCQTSEDLPSHNDWMSATERQQLSRLRFEKRRADWRLGRWTAKNSVASYLGMAPTDVALACIKISNTRDGVPQANFSGPWDDCAISISHSHGRALCAVAGSACEIGCDLELIEPRHPAFLTDYFTQGEHTMVASASDDQQACLCTALWSAKESALKALGTGLSRDTRELEICEIATPASSRWQPLALSLTPEHSTLQGWWCRHHNFVFTVVASPAAGLPLQLGTDTLGGHSI